MVHLALIRAAMNAALDSSANDKAAAFVAQLADRGLVVTVGGAIVAALGGPRIEPDVPEALAVTVKRLRRALATFPCSLCGVSLGEGNWSFDANDEPAHQHCIDADTLDRDIALSLPPKEHRQ